MRLALICDAMRAPIRGVGRVCATLLPELVREGEDVLPIDMARNEVAESICGFPTVVLPGRPGPARTARWHAGLLPRIARTDLLHDVLISTAGFPHVVGRHPRLCTFVHDLHMLERGFYQRGKRLWFRALLGRGLERAGLRICVSEATKRALEQRYPQLDPAHNVVIHNGVPERSGRAARSADERDAGFLFVGQFEHRKNLHRLLDAWQLARDDGVASELHLVGRPGPGGAAILDRALRLGGAGVRVHADASDNALNDLYARARGLLLPSLSEGFGLPVVEAMRAGVPVLTSAGTALEEVAADAALLVDPHDTEAIRAGIVALENDLDRRQELATRGVRRASDFSPTAQARKLRDAIHARWYS